MKRILSLLMTVCMLFSLCAYSVYAEDEVSIGMTAYDDNGRIISDLSGLTEVNVKLTITGGYTPAAGDRAYIAAFNGEKLIAVTLEDVTDSIVRFEDFKLPGEAKQELKAFIWNDLAPVTTNALDWTANAGRLTDWSAKGLYVAGNTLYFSYEANGVAEEDIASYQWLQANAEDGEYTVIEGAAGASYATPEVVSKSAADVYYKVKVTLKDGDVYTTEPVMVDGNDFVLENAITYARNWNTELTGTRAFTDADYIFTVDGQRFVLLDTVDTSDTMRFMVVADDSYGKYHLASEGRTDTAYEQQFTVGGLDDVEKLLPTDIVEYIDKTSFFEGSWITGGGVYLPGLKNEISVMSIFEIEKYKNIIGMCVKDINSGNIVQWATRSSSAILNDPNPFVWGVTGYEDGSITFNNYTRNNFAANWAADHYGHIRPLFYLDRSFLINEVDYNTAAPAIKRFMKKTYTKDEMLAAGYTEEELADFTDDSGYDSTYEKTIDSCSVRGILNSGNTLHFVYESADGVTDEDITVNWYKSDSKAGGYTYAGTGLTYQITPVTTTEYYYAKAVLPNGMPYQTDAVEIAGYNGTFAYWPNQMTDVSSSWTRESDKETVLEYTSTLTNDNNYFNGCSWKSNEEYMFTVNGRSFVLVDTIETSDTARYKIIADETYGKIHMANEEGRNELLNKLPEAIAEHIDNTVYYHGYCNAWGVFGGEIVCGAYIVSPEDLVTHKDRIGLLPTNVDTGEFAAYALNGNSKAKLNGGWIYSIEAYDEANSQLTIGINASNINPTFDQNKLKEVRPVFYVDKDFFTDEYESGNITGFGEEIGNLLSSEDE